MEQRLSLITLGVADLDAGPRLLRSARLAQRARRRRSTSCSSRPAGWCLALWDRERAAPRTAASSSARATAASRSRYNVRSPAEVDAVIAEARGAGRERSRREPGETFWGGYSGVLRRPRRPSVGGRAQPALDADADGRHAPRRALPAVRLRAERRRAAPRAARAHFQKKPAASYSPRPLRAKYHRR